MQLELFDKEDWQVLLEAEQYFNYLQKPNEAFSNMPVCPFLKAELEKDNLFVEIWKPDENFPKIPLLETRIKHLKEVCMVLSEHFDGQIFNLIKKADNSAVKLLNLIIHHFH